MLTLLALQLSVTKYLLLSLRYCLVPCRSAAIS